MIYINLISKNEKGVYKKIHYQIKALEKINKVLRINNVQKEEYYLGNFFLGEINEKKTFSSKVLRKIQIFKIFQNLKNEQIYINVRTVYVRFFMCQPFLYYYFKFLKKIGIKIILEIPTYPYDNEIKSQHIFVRMDRYYRLKLYKYVDKIVTYSKHSEIWGIPCINISNGIDLDEVKMINKESRDKNKIVFTSVSNCSFWHGIDRFLLSLKEYGKRSVKKDIEFNIVGEGAESNKFKDIVSKSEYLSKIVIFRGFKSGQELDDIYNKTNIGIGSLGIHRIGLTEVQPLKNREYAAKGIPFIISFIDPEFRNSNYVYKEESSDDIISIKKLIEWYEYNNFKPEIIREDSKRFIWDIQMKKVLDNI